MAEQSTARSIGALLSGSAIATVIGFAVQPVLTRLYAPEAFGVADLFVSVVTLLYPIGSLRYEDAILLPQRTDDASALVWLSLSISLGVCALLTLAPVSGRWLSGSYATLTPYLWALAPCLLALRLGRISESAAARIERFGAVAQSSVVRSSVMSSVRLLGGWSLPTPSVLIAAFGVGTAAAVAPQVWAVRSSGLLKWPGRTALTRAARFYRRFALFTTPAVFLHTATARLPILIIGAFALAGDVGQLGRTFFAIGAPLTLIAGSVGRVFVVEAAARVHVGADALANLSLTYLSRMVWTVAGPTAVAVVLGPDVFEWAFGPQWRPAGTYAQWLAPWMGVMACAGSLTGLFDVTGKQRSDAIFSVVHIAGIVGALLIGAHAGEWVGAGKVLGSIAALGIVGALLRVVHLCVLRSTAPGGPSWTRACLAPLLLSVSTAVLGLSANGSARLVVLFLGGLLYLALAWSALVRRRPGASVSHKPNAPPSE